MYNTINHRVFLNKLNIHVYKQGKRKKKKRTLFVSNILFHRRGKINGRYIRKELCTYPGMTMPRSQRK